jgi:hypothetical protein
MPAAAAKLAPALVTKDELLELAAWENKYADAKKKVAVAEKELKFRRQALAEKVLGVKSTDELKELTPEQISKRQLKRLELGDWKPERGAPEFTFAETSHGRYPAWQKLYVGELGETAAAGVQARTPVTYSYCVEVSVPA